MTVKDLLSIIDNDTEIWISEFERKPVQFDKKSACYWDKSMNKPVLFNGIWHDLFNGFKSKLNGNSELLGREIENIQAEECGDGIEIYLKE